MNARITVRDIAEAAHVSPSTVSRALSSTELVAPETRQRIVEIAERLGYSPNQAARGLITGRSNAIGVVIPDIEHPCYASIVKGVHQQGLREGYTVVLAESGGDPSSEASAVRRLKSDTDGIVLCSSKMLDSDIKALAGETTLVLVNSVCDGVETVGFDTEETIRQALEHLYALGHRHVAYAGGPESSWSDQRRRRGIEAVTPKFADLEVSSLGAFEPGFGGGRSAADIAIASGATAVLAFNDFMALEIMTRLRVRGYKVPEDFSVVGIDDIPAASLASPALTTVRTPLRQIGRAAVNILLDIVQPLASERPVINLPVGLVVRDSTSVVASPRQAARF